MSSVDLWLEYCQYGIGGLEPRRESTMPDLCMKV